MTTQELLGLDFASNVYSKRVTVDHFGQHNDPTDPLYLMKSNYYRNNFVQELDEIKMFTGNPGRVLLGELIQSIPKTNFHYDPHYGQNGYLKHIANVRDPTKFRHNTLHRTKNYLQYAPI